MTVPLADVIGNSNIAGRPAASIAGRLWYTTDEAPPGMYRDNGASWDLVDAGAGALTNPMTTDGDIIARIAGVADRVPKGAINTRFGVLPDGTLGYTLDRPSYAKAFAPVPSTGWTSVNGSGVAYLDGGYHVSPGQHNGNVLHCRLRSGGAAGTRNYAAYVVASFPAAGDEETGLLLNDSGSGKLIFFSIGWDSAAPGPCYRVSFWTDNATWVSEEHKEAMTHLGPSYLLCIETATTRDFYANFDGRGSYLLIHSTALTHITTQADRVGWGWNPNAASGARNMGASLVGWEQS